MQQVDPTASSALSQEFAIWRDRSVQMTGQTLQLPLLPITDVPALVPEQRQSLIVLVADLLIDALNAEVVDEQL
jgi:hypothetical protein